MATIDDQQIPDSVGEEFKRIIESIPPASLLSYVKSRPELVKGFRPTHANIKIIRKRLSSLFQETGEMDRGVLSFLAGESLNIELITVLSEKVLAYLFPTFAKFYGEKFVAAALLDGRKAVRTLAFSSLQIQENGADRNGKDESASVLRGELSAFLEHLSTLMTEEHGSSVGPEEDQKGELAAELKKSRKKITELERRLEKNKEKNRVGKKLSDKIGIKDIEIADLREKLGREKRTRKDLDEKVQSLSSEILKRKNNLQKDIENGVERQMKATVRGWLKKPSERAAAVFQIERRGSNDILARVEETLVRQKTRDQDFGNKVILNERLNKLQEAKAKIVQSGADALNPLPELLEMKKELDREIEKIQIMLGNSSGNTFIENLKIRINTAPTSQALTQMKDLLTELEQNDVLENSDLKELYLVYNRRMELHYERYGTAPEEKRQAVDPGWSIKKSLDERSGVHLIVDGYNVLFGLNQLFCDYYEDGVPAAQAREKLLEVLDIMLAGSNSNASVFFDGSVASERSYSANVKEIYSGGGLAEVRNRADGAILDYLVHLFSGGEKVPVFVVTNDLELQKMALEMGAKIIPLSQFDALVFENHA